MIVIWGRHHVPVDVGKDERFCPVCRSKQQTMLWELRLAPHIYGIDVGGGERAGWMTSCDRCGLTLFFEGDAPFRLDPAAEQARLDLEERVRQRKLDPAERHALIREALGSIAGMVHWRRSVRQSDGLSQLGCLGGGLIVLGLLACLAVMMESSEGPRAAILAALGLLLLFDIVLFVYAQRTRVLRYVRRELNPLLIRCLKPLDPSMEELRQVAAEISQSDPVTGAVLEPDCLWQGVAAAK